MPPREWRLRVRDILAAIAQIESFCGGLDAASFAEDERTIAAVLYELTIIGEAASQIPEHLRARHQEIDWRRLRDTRNFVTHVYFLIDAPRIWRLVKGRLPAVRDQLLTMLVDGGGDRYMITPLREAR